MSKPVQTIDDDISSTIDKLEVLLQYSNNPAAEEVLTFIEQAKRLWQGDVEDSWETD